jgi:polar amino acid transport system substrate-binding protein
VKRIISLLLIAVMAVSLVLTGCTKSTTKVRVASDATWKPFEFVNEQTKAIEGFDIDLFNAIAAKAGIEVEYVNVSWDPLLAGMAQGTYDAAISSITITADRAKQMLFSNPYFAAGQIITVLKSNTSINSKADLAGKKVAVQLGTTGNIEVDNIAGATSKPYDEIGLAFQDLMNGQVDAVVCDNPVALLYVNENPNALKTAGAVFTDEQYGIAVAKGKDDLLKKINDGLSQVKAAGTIDTLAEKWGVASKP